MTGDHRLQNAVRRLAKRRTPPALELKPTNPWEVAVSARLEAMQAELDRLRSQLNWLFTLIAGAAVANVVIALLQ